MVSKDCVAMILAGGQGSRLGALTKNVAKPAVPFGGKYRIIDFPLSNCVHCRNYILTEVICRTWVTFVSLQILFKHFICKYVNTH